MKKNKREQEKRKEWREIKIERHMARESKEQKRAG